MYVWKLSLDGIVDEIFQRTRVDAWDPVSVLKLERAED